MTHSIRITKYIKDILKEDKQLMKMLPSNKIFSIDAKMGTKFPFAAIERTSISSVRCKDGVYEDNVNITIYIASNSYLESIDIADEIRIWLEGHRYKDETIRITNVHLSGADEIYMNDAYIQRLQFEITVS